LVSGFAGPEHGHCQQDDSRNHDQRTQDRQDDQLFAMRRDKRDADWNGDRADDVDQTLRLCKTAPARARNEAAVEPNRNGNMPPARPINRITTLTRIINEPIIGSSS
jgi:hypothetical protein